MKFVLLSFGEDGVEARFDESLEAAQVESETATDVDTELCAASRSVCRPSRNVTDAFRHGRDQVPPIAYGRAVEAASPNGKKAFAMKLNMLKLAVDVPMSAPSLESNPHLRPFRWYVSSPRRLTGTDGRFVLDEPTQVKPEVRVIAEIPERNRRAECTAKFEWSSRRAGCPLRVRRCCDQQRAGADDETAEKSVHGVLLLFVKVRAVVAQRGI